MPATSSRSTGRQRAMAAMLLLAVAGAVIRWRAPQPSTLHDIGTLLLVLWLPAVGNLIAWLVRQVPRRPPPATDFAPGSAFTPHLRATLVRTAEADAALQAAGADAHRCAVIVGRQGFTARTQQPVAAALSQAAPVAIEFLHPASAWGQLPPQARFFLLVGTTAVATGHVVETLRQEPRA